MTDGAIEARRQRLWPIVLSETVFLAALVLALLHWTH